MVNTEMRISDLKHTMKEIEKKYEKRERIQMVNNEKRFSAVEHIMREMMGEFRRSYDEKERNEKSENEARLATAKDTTKNMMEELKQKYEERERRCTWSTTRKDFQLLRTPWTSSKRSMRRKWRLKGSKMRRKKGGPSNSKRKRYK